MLLFRVSLISCLALSQAVYAISSDEEIQTSDISATRNIAQSPSLNAYEKDRIDLDALRLFFSATPMLSDETYPQDSSDASATQVSSGTSRTNEWETSSIPLPIDEGSQPSQNHAFGGFQSERMNLIPLMKGRMLTTDNSYIGKNKHKGGGKLLWEADECLAQGTDQGMDEARKKYGAIYDNPHQVWELSGPRLKNAAAIGLAYTLLKSPTPDYQRAWRLLSEVADFSVVVGPIGSMRIKKDWPAQFYCFVNISLGSLCQMGYKDGLKGDPDFEEAIHYYDDVTSKKFCIMQLHPDDKKILIANLELLLPQFPQIERMIQVLKPYDIQDKPSQTKSDQSQQIDESSQSAQNPNRIELLDSSESRDLFPSLKGRILTTDNQRIGVNKDKGGGKLLREADELLAQGTLQSMDEARRKYEQVYNHPPRQNLRIKSAAATGLAYTLAKSLTPDYKRTWRLLSEAADYGMEVGPTGKMSKTIGWPGNLYCFVNISLGRLCQMGYKGGIKGRPDHEEAIKFYDRVKPKTGKMSMHPDDQKNLLANLELLLPQHPRVDRIIQFVKLCDIEGKTPKGQNTRSQQVDEGSQSAQQSDRMNLQVMSDVQDLFPSPKGRMLTTDNPRIGGKAHKRGPKLYREADECLAQGTPQSMDEARRKYEALYNHPPRQGIMMKSAAAAGLAYTLVKSPTPDYEMAWRLLSEAADYGMVVSPTGTVSKKREWPGQLYCFVNISLGRLCQMGYKGGIRGVPDHKEAIEYYKNVTSPTTKMLMHPDDQKNLRANLELLLPQYPRVKPMIRFIKSYDTQQKAPKRKNDQSQQVNEGSQPPQKKARKDLKVSNSDRLTRSDSRGSPLSLDPLLSELTTVDTGAPLYDIPIPPNEWEEITDLTQLGHLFGGLDHEVSPDASTGSLYTGLTTVAVGVSLDEVPIPQDEWDEVTDPAQVDQLFEDFDHEDSDDFDSFL